MCIRDSLTYDPLAMMAHADQDQLLNLLHDTQFADKAVNDMLEALANGERLPMPDLTEYPTLADGDKPAFGQMTFTVTDDQRMEIEGALKRAKYVGGFDDTENANSNGNALALIAMEYERG